ncbi:PilZ domain-containing protein [uncultured Desulfuromusa sp.]|uniref:PilZ domain-containing protein n=1 Tax=uncultured Desulfuromusa sp. TaxID=219183 RepID=UPI002AA82803|nr:PilZ domain-containing protein [uncultured Desulfuromusa sp.]
MEETQDRPKADSRKNLRSPLIIQKVHINSDRPAFFGYTKNISKSGMFIATTNPIQAGEQIDLEFPLPAPLKGTARCRCEVVWKRPHGTHLPFEPGMGVKFLDMPSDITERLDEWIKKQS